MPDPTTEAFSSQVQKSNVRQQPLPFHSGSNRGKSANDDDDDDRVAQLMPSRSKPNHSTTKYSPLSASAGNRPSNTYARLPTQDSGQSSSQAATTFRIKGVALQRHSSLDRSTLDSSRQSSISPPPDKGSAYPSHSNHHDRRDGTSSFRQESTTVDVSHPRPSRRQPPMSRGLYDEDGCRVDQTSSTNQYPHSHTGPIRISRSLVQEGRSQPIPLPCDGTPSRFDSAPSSRSNDLDDGAPAKTLGHRNERENTWHDLSRTHSNVGENPLHHTSRERPEDAAIGLDEPQRKRSRFEPGHGSSRSPPRDGRANNSRIATTVQAYNDDPDREQKQRQRDRRSSPEVVSQRDQRRSPSPSSKSSRHRHDQRKRHGDRDELYEDQKSTYSRHSSTDRRYARKDEYHRYMPAERETSCSHQKNNRVSDKRPSRDSGHHSGDEAHVLSRKPGSMLQNVTIQDQKGDHHKSSQQQTVKGQGWKTIQPGTQVLEPSPSEDDEANGFRVVNPANAHGGKSDGDQRRRLDHNSDLPNSPGSHAMPSDTYRPRRTDLSSPRSDRTHDEDTYKSRATRPLRDNRHASGTNSRFFGRRDDEREWERERDGPRSQRSRREAEPRERMRGKETEKDHDDAARDGAKSRDRNAFRARDSDNGWDRDPKERNRDRNADKNRDRNWNWSRNRDQDRDGYRGRNDDWRRDRERDTEWNREWHRNREGERDRGRDRSSTKERDREPDGGRQRDRLWDKERDGNSHRDEADERDRKEERNKGSQLEGETDTFNESCHAEAEEPDLEQIPEAAYPDPPRAGPGEGYERISQVGEGTYGQVFKARSEKLGALVALKRIRMETEKDGFPVTAMREIKLLQALRHNNVIRLHEMMVTKGSIYMVFEYMEHDLTGILAHPNIHFTPAHLKSLSFQLFQGLHYLHKKAVLHRDLKGSNILLNNQGLLKLADFGLARFYMKRRNGDYTNRVVTLWYRPPELLFGATQYGPEVDMWGAGCIFLELFTLKPVFQGSDEVHQVQVVSDVLGAFSRSTWPGVEKLPWYELLKPVDGTGPDETADCVKDDDSNMEMDEDDDQADKLGRPEAETSQPRRDAFETAFGELMPPSALDLVRGLLCYHPTQRFSAAEALKMKYFSEAPKAEMPARLLSNVGGEWHEYESRRARKKVSQRAQDKGQADAQAAHRMTQTSAVSSVGHTGGGGGSVSLSGSLDGRSTVISPINGQVIGN